MPTGKTGLVTRVQQQLLAPGVRECAPTEIFDVVRLAVAKAIADLNHRATEQETYYMVNELTDNIIDHYPSLRISEIPGIIARGIRGHYGDFFGLSVISFEKFISAYMNSDQRLQAVHSLPPPPDDAPREVPTEAQQFETMVQNTLHAYQRKAEGKNYDSLAALVYNFLDRLHLLQFTTAEKYDMMQDAARLLSAEIKIKLLCAPGYQRHELQRNMQAYADALTGSPLSAEQHAQVIRKAKQLAVEAFFNELDLNGQGLQEVLRERA